MHTWHNMHSGRFQQHPNLRRVYDKLPILWGAKVGYVAHEVERLRTGLFSLGGVDATGSDTTN